MKLVDNVVVINMMPVLFAGGVPLGCAWMGWQVIQNGSLWGLAIIGLGLTALYFGTRYLLQDFGSRAIEGYIMMLKAKQRRQSLRER